MQLPSGLVLQKRYQIVRLVGQGGMGAVYEAIDQRLGHTVAVKQILRGDPGAFAREARLLARLRHPALPKVTDSFTDEAGQFLVMEFVPGNNLETLLNRQRQPFAAPKVLDWADQLLETLIYLHSHQPPVLHRDIKPANLKLTDQGKLILLDFGLAKGRLGQTSELQRSVQGYTLCYAAPEQIRGEGTEPRSDLYAVGATLYHLLSGAHPPDALQRAFRLAEGKADPLGLALPRTGPIPVALAAVLRKAMALAPTDRFASAAALRAALRESNTSTATEVASVPAFANPAPALSQARPQVKRSRLSLFVWVGLALGLLALGWIGFLLSTNPNLVGTGTTPSSVVTQAPAIALDTTTSTPAEPPTATPVVPLPTPTLPATSAPTMEGVGMITATAAALSPTALLTPTQSVAVTATATPPSSPTATATPDATATNLVQQMVAATLTALAPTITPTPTPTATPSLTPSSTPSATPTATATLTPNGTATTLVLQGMVAATLTALAPTITPTPSPTATPTPTLPPTATASFTPNTTQTTAAVQRMVAATLTALAPTFTPTPMARNPAAPTATLVAPPTAPPTATPVPTFTPKPAAVATNPPRPASSGNPAATLGSVVLLDPAADVTLGDGDVAFRWQATNGADSTVQTIVDPASEYLFELVVVSDPNQPGQARGLVGATKAFSVNVKRDAWAQNPWGLENGKQYYWTVRLGKQSGDRYEALGFLAQPRLFTLQIPGADNGGASRKD